MFREMRRSSQLLSEEDTQDILRRNTSGVLALIGDDGYPYTVPLSYVYENGKLYFHCAKEGHKIDAILNNNKVSFCVIDKDEVVPEAFNTLYRSVIAFGRAKIISEDKECKLALELLIKKYSPEHTSQGEKEIEKYWDKVCVIEVLIEHITGKASRDFLSGN